MAALMEGGIAETLSVLESARQLDDDVDRNELTLNERAGLLTIVSDELRHAALAWRTVAWASAISMTKKMKY